MGRGFGFQSDDLGVGFFAAVPGLGLIMYILTTLEFFTHNFDFHLLITSVNAKYFISHLWPGLLQNTSLESLNN